MKVWKHLSKGHEKLDAPEWNFKCCKGSYANVILQFFLFNKFTKNSIFTAIMGLRNSVD